MGRHLSPRYGHVKMVSGYSVLTTVNYHNIDLQHQFAGSNNSQKVCHFTSVVL